MLRAHAIVGVILAFLGVAAVAIAGWLLFFCAAGWCPNFSYSKAATVNDFSSCQRMGYPVQETEPPRCTAGGKVYYEAPQQRVRVIEPLRGQEVALPLLLGGEARIGSGMTLHAQLRDTDGFALVEETVMLPQAQSGQIVPFSAALSYPRPLGTGGTLVVSLRSSRGKPVEAVTVPVRFIPAAAVEIKAFFGNTERDPEALYCDVSYPVARRIALSENEMEASLDALLAGPNDQEKAQGFFSSLPEGLAVLALQQDKGVVTVVFNRALRDGIAGSCRVSAIRSQIERTLKQFPTVEEVKVRIEGVPDEEVLQP